MEGMYRDPNRETFTKLPLGTSCAEHQVGPGQEEHPYPGPEGMGDIFRTGGQLILHHEVKRWPVVTHPLHP